MKFRYLIMCMICFVLLGTIGPFGFKGGDVFALDVDDLDFSRRIDWTQAGYPGDIPDVSANVINIIIDAGAKGDGTGDDYNAIQAAIDSAPNPAVIFFPAGTYRIESQINLKSGVVLRGEGSDKTHLEFLSANGCLAINGAATAGYVSILSGLEKGSDKIVVSDVSNFTVGQGGEIRQEDIVRPAANWGEYYVGQMVKILEIDIENKTLTIDPPLHIGLNSSQKPEILPVQYVDKVGIEDLHIKRIDSNHDTSNVNINRAANCWIRRVESDYTLKYHFSISRSLHLEIRDSYIHDAKSKGDGGQGYGVSLSRWVTSVLVENNIFYELRHAMIIQIGVNGCVFGYNYAERNYSDDGWDKTYISIHGHYPFMNLYEGNIVGRVGIADYWGPSGPGNTFFRNRVIGTDKHMEFGPYRGIEVDDYSHQQNIIGNELTGSQTQITFDGQDDITQGTSTDVLVHGNNVHGIFTWDSSIPDEDLPASFYLSSKPDFFGTLDLPSMGGKMPLGQGTIPAELRRINGSHVPQPGEAPIQNNCELLGHLTYCQDCEPCLEGQGNCQDDNECDGDLICAQNVGAYYGWPVYINVCVPKDEITIITAKYKAKSLEVESTSSAQPDAVLTIHVDGMDYGIMTFDSADNKYVFKQKISDPVENVTVTSNFGGSDTFDLGEGPVCGDTNCDAGEDQCNCASDCGTPPTTETNCSDGIDEDCDTDTDCDDADCLGDIACPYSYCGDATCDPDEDQCDCAADCGNPPSMEISCIDGDDNDCDKDIDCDDADCLGDPACDCKQKGEGCSINGECCSNDCRGKKCK